MTYTPKEIEKKIEEEGFKANNYEGVIIKK